MAQTTPSKRNAELPFGRRVRGRPGAIGDRNRGHGNSSPGCSLEPRMREMERQEVERRRFVTWETMDDERPMTASFLCSCFGGPHVWKSVLSLWYTFNLLLLMAFVENDVE